MRWTLPLLFAAASSLPAQYALSAMAGYIHYTEGEVWLGDRAIAPKPQDFEHVLEGRRLRTGAGKAEILLVPGSFVRVGEGSEIEMVSSGLTSAKLELLRGSLVVDLQTLYEKDSIAIQAGDSEILFRKTGMYRIDRKGSASLRVIDGRAHVVSATEDVDVKSGREIELGAASPEKYEAPFEDALSAWNGVRREKLGVLAEQARQERWDGMSEAERDLLRMILRQPSPTTVSVRQPAPSGAPPAGGNGSRR